MSVIKKILTFLSFLYRSNHDARGKIFLQERVYAHDRKNSNHGDSHFYRLGVYFHRPAFQGFYIAYRRQHIIKQILQRIELLLHGAVQLGIHEGIPLTDDTKHQDGSVDRLADRKKHPPVGLQIISPIHIDCFPQGIRDRFNIAYNQNHIVGIKQIRYNIYQKVIHQVVLLHKNIGRDGSCRHVHGQGAEGL